MNNFTTLSEMKALDVVAQNRKLSKIFTEQITFEPLKKAMTTMLEIQFATAELIAGQIDTAAGKFKENLSKMNK